MLCQAAAWGQELLPAFYRREPRAQSHTPSLPLLLECGLETRSKLWLEQEGTRFFPGEHELPGSHGQQPGDSADRDPGGVAGRADVPGLGVPALGHCCSIRAPGQWDSFLALPCVASGRQHPVLPHPDFRRHLPCRDVSVSRCFYASSTGQ